MEPSPTAFLNFIYSLLLGVSCEMFIQSPIPLLGVKSRPSQSFYNIDASEKVLLHDT